MLIYPKLTPPEFKVSHIETNSFHIHYFSKKENYKSLLEDCCGLGKLYGTVVSVELIHMKRRQFT
jgi:hypothetical protein